MVNLKQNTTAQLSYRFEIDSERNLMLVHLSGCLDKTSLAKLMNDVKVSQNRKSNFDRIYDLSEVDFQILVSEYEEILQQIQSEFKVTGEKHKVAFVAKDNFTLKLLAIYKTYAQRYSFYTVDYFNSVKKAIHWITSD